MSGTPGNVIQSRDIQLFTEAYTSANAMPADSAAGTAPGGSWVDKGFTDGGIDARFGVTYSDVHVDQNIYPIYTIGTAGDVHMLATLAEATVSNLQQTTGQGAISTVNASSGVRGHTDLTIDGTVAVNYWSVLFQIKNSAGDGEDVRILGRRGIAKGTPQPKFVGTAKAVLPLDVQLYPDPSNSNQVIVWRDIIAALP
jgi:hypothetical protein